MGVRRRRPIHVSTPILDNISQDERKNTHKCSTVLHELPTISHPLTSGSRTKINKVESLAAWQDSFHGLMQKRKELFEPSRSALFIKLEEQFPHSRAEDGPPVVHVLSWWHPDLVSHVSSIDL